MRRPPSSTGSSILPVSCRYPHIITYTEASVITAGSMRVETVPDLRADEGVHLPRQPVKKMSPHRGSALIPHGFFGSGALQSMGGRFFMVPMALRPLAAIAFWQSSDFGRRVHRPRTRRPSPSSLGVLEIPAHRCGAGPRGLLQPATGAAMPATARAPSRSIRRYQDTAG